MGILFIFPLLIIILAVLASCIRIVPQSIRPARSVQPI